MTPTHIVNFPPLEVVRQALVAVDVSALSIYAATGLTPGWQQTFTDGRTKDPGYGRICKLIEWLVTNHPAVWTEALKGDRS